MELHYLFMNVFLSHIVKLFFIFKVLLCPSLSRVSRPPFTQNSAAIVSRSVKVLPFLASLMSFHQRVFLTRQIVFGEFFYAFFFLCARLLLFLFTHFCVCLLCLFGKLKMTGYVKMLYKYSDSIF